MKSFNKVLTAFNLLLNEWQTLKYKKASGKFKSVFPSQANFHIKLWIQSILQTRTFSNFEANEKKTSKKAFEFTVFELIKLAEVNAVNYRQVNFFISFLWAFFRKI